MQRLATSHHTSSRVDCTFYTRAVDTMTMLDAPVVYTVETSDCKSILAESSITECEKPRDRQTDVGAAPFISVASVGDFDFCRENWYSIGRKLYFTIGVVTSACMMLKLQLQPYRRFCIPRKSQVIRGTSKVI